MNREILCRRLSMTHASLSDPLVYRLVKALEDPDADETTVVRFIEAQAAELSRVRKALETLVLRHNEPIQLLAPTPSPPQTIDTTVRRT